jgi:nucleoid-associated protein YgaU
MPASLLSRTKGLALALGLVTAGFVAAVPAETSKSEETTSATVQDKEAERGQLEAELAAVTAELAQLRVNQAKLAQNADLSKLSEALAKAEAELTQMRGVARELAERNQQLEDVAAERGRAMALLRKELAEPKAAVEAVPAAAAADASRLTALEAEKTHLEKQLGEAQEQLRKLSALSERVDRAERDASLLRSQNEQLSQTLRQQELGLKEGGDNKAVVDRLTADNKALSQKLASAIADLAQLTRRNEALVAEASQLRMTVPAGVSDPVEHVDRVDALQKQLAEQTERAVAAEAKLASVPAAPGGESPELASSRRQLAETEMKLATALRSYSLLQRELEEARAGAGERTAEVEARLSTAQSEAGALRSQLQVAQADLQERNTAVDTLQKEAVQLRQNAIAQGLELVGLRDQLRQTQAQLASLAEESAQRRTRLAVNTPPPASSLALPTRPGSPAAQSAGLTLPPALGKAPVEKPAATEPAGEKPLVQAPRFHVVVEGDTLSRISRRYYGTTERWKEIFEANRAVVSDPARLPRGSSLRIP